MVTRYRPLSAARTAEKRALQRLFIVKSAMAVHHRRIDVEYQRRVRVVEEREHRVLELLTVGEGVLHIIVQIVVLVPF